MDKDLEDMGGGLAKDTAGCQLREGEGVSSGGGQWQSCRVVREFGTHLAWPHPFPPVLGTPLEPAAT